MDRLLSPAECERYCTEKVNKMTELMKEVFDDIHSVLREPSCDAPTTNGDDGNNSSNFFRSSIKQIETTVLVKNMEATVLSRLLEAKQKELRSLEYEKRGRLILSNQTPSPSLPRLPEEIISMIFKVFYYDVDDGSTIDELLGDNETPERLKRLIRRGIPIVVADLNDDWDDLATHFDRDAEIVGPSPSVFSVEELVESEEFGARTSISVMICRSTWPSSKDLDSLSNFHWKNLFIRYVTHDEQDQRDQILHFLQKPEIQLKLREIEYLEIPAKENYYDESRPLTVLDVDEACGSNLRMVNLPFPALLSLRPILNQIVDLEVVLQPTMTNFNLAIDAIRPLSNNLIRLVLWGPYRYYPGNEFPVALPVIEQGTIIPFPRLMVLTLVRISERNCRDILSVFQCSNLEEISVEKTLHSEAKYEAVYELDNYVSVEFLHKKFPSLMRLHLYTSAYENGFLMLSHLARPSTEPDGQWLLPKLDTIFLDSSRGPILEMLTEIVVNRMRTQSPISRIRSVTLPGFSERFEYTLQGAYLTTLNLLVPEVRIVDG